MIGVVQTRNRKQYVSHHNRINDDDAGVTGLEDYDDQDDDGDDDDNDENYGDDGDDNDGNVNNECCADAQQKQYV